MSYTIEVNLGLVDLKVDTRRQVFEKIVENAASEINYPKHVLCSKLLEQEKAHGSGLGEGIAIPNIRLSGIKKRFVILATLERGVDFHTIDHMPVDIVCVFISPESDGNIHLRGLSRMARLLKNKSLQQKLREARDGETLKSLLNDPEGWLMAA